MGMDNAAFVELDILREIAQRLDSAKHGGKGEVLREVTRLYGWSQGTLYRKLKEIGFNSGRKTRKDAGTTQVSEEALLTLEGLRDSGIRKNGKVTMDTPVAREIALTNGLDADVSSSTLNRLFRARHTSTKQLKQDTPSVKMRSLHPNHVHQVDPSLCVLYYAPDGSQHMMEADKFYKNKLENYNKVKLKCWRYTLTDHFSNSVVVKYYAAQGENTTNLFDFLCYAWTEDGKVIHGAPQLLYWDKGSANGAHAIRNFLDQLEIEHLTHQAGNARAKGSVEGGNNLVEKQFECRLKVEPVESVEELNQQARAWMIAYNSNTIKHQDTRLKRKGMREPVARFALWQMIRKEQLRLLPNRDICQALLTAKPVTRTVDNDLMITFVHPNIGKSMPYSLRHCEGVVIGMEVKVSAFIYGEAFIKATVKTPLGEELHHKVAPEEFDQISGMPLNGPVFGQSYQTQADTQVEKAKKAINQHAYPNRTQEEIQKAKDKQHAPFDGKLVAHSHLAKQAAGGPAFMKKPGETITPASISVTEDKTLTNMALRLWMKKRTPRDFTEAELEWLKGLGEVKESQLSDLLQQLRDGIADQAAPTAPPILKVV